MRWGKVHHDSCQRLPILGERGRLDQSSEGNRPLTLAGVGVNHQESKQVARLDPLEEVGKRARVNAQSEGPPCQVGW